MDTEQDETVFERFRQVLYVLQKRPSAILVDTRFETVAAFVAGFDLGCQGELLNGFREWLLETLQVQGSSYHWTALVRTAGRDKDLDDTKTADDDKATVERLLALLEMFTKDK